MNKQIDDSYVLQGSESPLACLHSPASIGPGCWPATGFVPGNLALLLWLCFCLPLAVASTGIPAEQDAHPFDSRNLSFMRIAIEQGLSQGAANAIVQDKQGFIWFGTQEGLNRYDGQSIKVYEHLHNEPTSLSNDWIWSLLVDHDGVLWVGTDGGGLNRFDHERNVFTHFRHNPADATSLSNDRVRVIYQDLQGVYWLGTDGGGLNRFDPQTGQFDRYQHNPDDLHSLPHDSVLSILEDRAGNLWIGTNGGGLAKLDRRSGRFERFRHDPTSVTSLSQDQVRALFEDQHGQLWVGTYESGLNQFDPGTGTFTRFQHNPADATSLSNNRVRCLFQDREGTLWVATDGGLNEWLPDTHRFVNYQHNPTDPSSLSDNRVTTLYQDLGGVLWIGTYNGVNKWNYVSDAFTYYQKYGTQLKLSSNIVTSVMESAANVLWVGTYGGGLNQLNLASGEAQYFRHETDNPHSLQDDRVMTLFVDDSEQVVWVGTRNGGLNRLDPQSGQFTHYRHDPDVPSSLSANGVTSILVEPDGIIWVGTYGGGLNLGNTHTGQFSAFRHDPNDSSTLSSDRVLAIYRDRAGVLWVGTEDGGLNRYDERSQSFMRYLHQPANPFSLSNNAAWDILEGRDGSLWIATGGGGLNRWLAEDRQAGRPLFKAYRKGDGLRSDTVHGIVQDAAGFLWLSSNRGLQRFDPDSGEVRDYDRSTGLKGNEFNTAARFKSQTGRLYFGGTTGLVAFHPNQIRSNQHQPDIALTAITRGGPLYTVYSGLPDDTTLELGYQNDLITFAFTGLDFTSPEKNQYRYKLEGFDTKWSDPVSFKRTTYTNLPAGSYTFRVMASNNDGVWNEQGSNLMLEVIPPPWKTTWAYALYTLVAISIMLAYVKVQARKFAQEKLQRIELERQVHLRTQEIAERNDQLQALNKQLKNASVTDDLTGLNNRRYLESIIQSNVALVNRQVREMNQPDAGATVTDIAPSLSFMMIDLDGFKAINDTYGHYAGDQALLQVRDILQQCCRKSDTIIRWGGDEFMIVSRNSNQHSAETLAERIRIRLADHLYQLGGGNTGRMTGSIGVALYPFSLQQPERMSWEQVASIADRGTYIAKENGRNAWVGLYGTHSTSIEDVADIKHGLATLLEQNDLRLTTSIRGKLIFSPPDQKANARDLSTCRQ